MTLGIHVFVQPWNSFLEELKTTKQKITHTDVTEDLFVKKKNIYKFINVTIVERTENAYRTTRQNLYFAHANSNKKKNYIWQVNS